MKNLLFITSFGLAVVFSNAAFGQDVKDGDSTRNEAKVNAHSNGKHNPNRTFGKDRAATVQEMNGETEKIGDKDNKKKVEEKSVSQEHKKLKKDKDAAKNKEKKIKKSGKKSPKKHKEKDEDDEKTE